MSKLPFTKGKSVEDDNFGTDDDESLDIMKILGGYGMKKIEKVVYDMMNLVEEIKENVVKYHNLAKNAKTLDEMCEYDVECEQQMEMCGEAMNMIFDLIDEYELEINYVGFDTSLIWDYLK